MCNIKESYVQWNAIWYTRCFVRLPAEAFFSISCAPGSINACAVQLYQASLYRYAAAMDVCKWKILKKVSLRFFHILPFKRYFERHLSSDTLCIHTYIYILFESCDNNLHPSYWSCFILSGNIFRFLNLYFFFP